jgi:hypothetical protein
MIDHRTVPTLLGAGKQRNAVAGTGTGTATLRPNAPKRAQYEEYRVISKDQPET